MKYLKLLAIALTAAFVTSCGDDDKMEYNSNKDVTVSMVNADMSFSENKGIVRVPFELKGKANGIVTVTCEIGEVTNIPGVDPAMDEAHYLLTSQTVNVDTLDTTGYFEVRLLDDADENDPRAFFVRLVSAEGATISGIQETICTIKDNDSDPYGRLGGEWYVKLNDGEVRTVLFDTFDEGEDGYYEYYMLSGLLDGADVKAKFNYNPNSMMGDITIEYGQDLPNIDHPSYGLGIGFLGFMAGGYLFDEGDAVFTWNEDFTEITLESWAGQDEADYEGADFTYFLHFDAGYMYYDDCQGVKVFTRVKP